MVAKTKNSKPTASEAPSAELTSQDVKNVLALINGVEIKVEQAEIVVQLKIKLINLHNALAAGEQPAAK